MKANLILVIIINQQINTIILIIILIDKKPIKADYSALTEKIETNPKDPKFNLSDRFKITKYNNIFSIGYTKNWSREIFIINSVLKANPWAYKIKDLNR